MTRASFTTSSGLVGWTTGSGPRVLALHGGPGLAFGYLDPVVDELAGRYEVATFQQRGLAPSVEDGAFTIAEALADVEAVLDTLGWDKAWLVGHSWGGHLAFHAAVALPERFDGVLAVDPLGGFGDGGAAGFITELLGRAPEADRARAVELGEKETTTPEEDREAMRLVWPSYFAVPADAPPMPEIATSAVANTRLWGDLVELLPGLEAALPTISLPLGVLVGAGSPMPASTGTGTAARVPGAWSHVVPGAGHFLWHEAPGAVLAATDRLTGPPA
ncbi:MAG: alpha/beta fold hydrolase [Marmoricola sp.]